MGWGVASNPAKKESVVTRGEGSEEVSVVNRSVSGQWSQGVRGLKRCQWSVVTRGERS